LAWRHLYTALVKFPCPNKIDHFVHNDRGRKTKLLSLSLLYSLQLSFVIFWLKNISAKVARKMLVISKSGGGMTTAMTSSNVTQAKSYATQSGKIFVSLPKAYVTHNIFKTQYWDKNNMIKRHFSSHIFFSCVNWKYLFLDNQAYWNLVWKYFKMSLQYCEEKKIYFYQNVFLSFYSNIFLYQYLFISVSFYINIVCKNIVCDVCLHKH